MHLLSDVRPEAPYRYTVSVSTSGHPIHLLSDLRPRNDLSVYLYYYRVILYCMFPDFDTCPKEPELEGHLIRHT
jgi:hypothetical protein